MDIQKEKFNELFDLWVDVAHKENVKNFGSLMADALKVSLTAMRDVNKNFFDEGVEFAQKVAVPDTTAIVLALENVQTEVSQSSFVTMDADNESEIYAVDANKLSKYIDDLIEAQEQVG